MSCHILSSQIYYIDYSAFLYPSHISLKGFSLLADVDGGLIDGHQAYMKVDTWYDKCKLPYYSIFSLVENMSR